MTVKLTTIVVCSWAQQTSHLISSSVSTTNDSLRGPVTFDTILHIFMVIMVAICLWQNNPFDGDMSVSKYQHHAAVWGCFTCWIQMSLYMERLPKFGIYLLMLRKVARTFMKLAWSYTSLIFAFGCAFYLVFPSQYYFQNDLPSVFVKVF